MTCFGESKWYETRRTPHRLIMHCHFCVSMGGVESIRTTIEEYCECTDFIALCDHKIVILNGIGIRN